MNVAEALGKYPGLTLAEAREVADAPKRKPDSEILSRHDHLGGVLFHAIKSLRSLEDARESLRMAGGDNARAMAALNAAINSQMVASRWANSQRLELQHFYIIE